MPLNFFYTMVQESQNDQKLKSRGGGGPALSLSECSVGTVQKLGERVHLTWESFWASCQLPKCLLFL